MGTSLDFLCSAWHAAAAARALRPVVPPKKDRPFLGACLSRGSLTAIPELVLDPEFRALLRRNDPAVLLSAWAETDVPPAVSLFLAPEDVQQGVLCSEIAEFMAEMRGKSQVLRSGFVSSEAGVLETAALGFDGLLFHVCNQDRYELQYCVEVCRDHGLSMIAVVNSAERLATVIATDVPYVGFWCYGSTDFSDHFSMAVDLIPRVPSSCLSFLIAPTLLPAQLEAAQTLGVAGVFV